MAQIRQSVRGSQESRHKPDSQRRRCGANMAQLRQSGPDPGEIEREPVSCQPGGTGGAVRSQETDKTVKAANKSRGHKKDSQTTDKTVKASLTRNGGIDREPVSWRDRGGSQESRPL
jgi:hypothetical protein